MSEVMNLWAIRHKATGKLMPQLNGRGYSYWNPNTDTEPDTSLGVPRLVKSKTIAKFIVGQWSQGIHKRTIIRYGEYGENEIVDVFPDGRKKEDLEIVQVQLLIYRNKE